MDPSFVDFVSQHLRIVINTPGRKNVMTKILKEITNIIKELDTIRPREIRTEQELIQAKKFDDLFAFTHVFLTEKDIAIGAIAMVNEELTQTLKVSLESVKDEVVKESIQILYKRVVHEGKCSLPESIYTLAEPPLYALITMYIFCEN